MPMLQPHVVGAGTGNSTFRQEPLLLLTVEIKTSHWKPQTEAGHKKNRPTFPDHLRNRLVMTDLSTDTPVATHRSEKIGL